MAAWPTFLNKAFLSMHGRLIGLFTLNLQGSGDKVLAGDGLHGILESVAIGLTAGGTTQAAALQLTSFVNQLTTVTAATDAVALPVSVPGMTITVINDAAANACAVFPAVGDAGATIDAAASAPITAAHRSVFKAIAAGTWISYGTTKST